MLEKVNDNQSQSALATFGNGCFWCTEAIFEQLDGVSKVESGYAGGHVKNPAYREVCEGRTGHAEVIQITFDPQMISYLQLLQVFFKTHDPTTLNRQGNDIGTQYRSAIFYHDEQQNMLAHEVKDKLSQSGVYETTIVTEISPFTVFYKAEDYHQHYFQRHGSESYCQHVILPKLEKFKEVFADTLKD